ncbi:MAG: glycosyltransferase family 9 protein [Chloroflexota bacterium]
MSADVRRVLVLRPGAIGDTLVTLPALMALRRAYPVATIEIAGNATALPLVQAGGVIDRWLSFDDARVTRLFMPSPPADDDHFAGLDVAVAWGRDPDGVLRQSLERRGARQIVVAPSRLPIEQPVHVARHLLQSLEPLGIASAGSPKLPAEIRDDVRFWLPRFVFPPEVEALARAELDAAGLTGCPFVVIHPGSGSAAKNWPAASYAWVMDRLASQYGIKTVILAGPADADALAIMRNRDDHVGMPTGSLTLIDQPLLHVAAIMSHAGGFVGNDSGLSHLAGLLGIPTLTLFGPSDPVLWKPLGPVVRVLRSASLEAIAPEVVLEELLELYDGP